MRKVKIVATLGPATASAAAVRELVRAGMDVARLNFSHGDYDFHRAAFTWVRQAADAEGRPVAVMQDLQGIKIRTGRLAGGQPVELRTGHRLVLTTEPVEGTQQRISCSYPLLPAQIRPGDRLLLSDGLLELRAERINGPDVHCLVVNGGLLRESQGINLPSGFASGPALTEKDIADLDFGLRLGVDLVAVSFVRRAEDVEAVRERIRRAGSDVPLVAKIEKPSAVEHLEAIVRSADGVLVARGDLGVELSLEEVPAIQKSAVRQALVRNRTAVIATQMLDSMIRQPSPTRAEVSDVANAVLDGADALMLSGETAIGKFPLRAVETMARIIEEAEKIQRLATLPPVPEGDPVAPAICEAVCRVAELVSARAIVVFTQSGYTAKLVSAFRPVTPILALTPDSGTARRMTLYWGVQSLLMREVEGVDELLAELDQILRQRGLAATGDRVALVGGTPLRRRGITNLLKLHEVGER
jgi:pyruvate kinase